MRPPSRGNAGTMLNTSSAALMKPSQPISASAGVVLKPSRVERHVGDAAAAGQQHGGAPRQSANSSSVTAGPAAATSNSSPALCGFAAHLREPAEGPQVDPDDLDAQPARDERVSELVQHQRREVAERTGDGDGVGGASCEPPSTSRK